MKKVWILLICGMAVLAGLVALFWDPILDFLPIDQSGWKATEQGRCYLDEDGDPLTGWQELSGSRYYFDPASGTMVTGWLDVDGTRFHLSPDGTPTTGWLTEDGATLYLDEQGSPVTGWQEIDGHRRYFDPISGAMATGWLDADGHRYHFSPEGTLTTGWLAEEGGRYLLDENGIMQTGWQDTAEGRYYLTETGAAHIGWLEVDKNRYWFREDGVLHTGWLDTDTGRYYLAEDGTMFTGWLELDGRRFYLTSDGTAARGRVEIDGQTNYFSAKGEYILMVNRWNYKPEGYEPDLVDSKFGCTMDRSCIEALDRMLTDLKAVFGAVGTLNGYRGHGTQNRMFYGNIQDLIASGVSPSQAYYLTSRSVALPGTSEHEMGLALDILDPNNPYYEGGEPESVLWLKEHCWDYGFILRYPDGKTDITGIIYEPWHYRYVGVELALEIRDTGLCLEEYLDLLTGDGTTCGNPDAQKTE